MAVDGVQVEGFQVLQRVFAKAERETRLELRHELRALAEPVRADAERLANSGIRHIGPKWGRMRIGVTQREVYVVPREKGVRGRGPSPRRRPKFANLMQTVAMEPALRRNEPQIEASVERLLEDIARRFNRA